MENQQNTLSATAANSASILELGNYQQQLLEKYKNLSPGEITANPDNQALMAFNGYYSLGGPSGNFFAIDSNMIVLGSFAPSYTVDLLIIMDGLAPTKTSFTGTFDGQNLKQVDADGLTFDLTFTRTDGSDGTTIKYAGTIILANKTIVPVSGSSYNNLIPSTLFTGKYYVPVPPDGEVISDATPVMQIMGNEVLYDNGKGKGLQEVIGYAYNMNMYFFVALTADLETVFLIMGSAAEGGLACNNIILSSPVAQKSLQTIQYPPTAKLISPNPQSAELAAFSGYYQISSLPAGAFISIEGEYITSNGAVDVNKVKIGVSLDGVKSNAYYFETGSMTFSNNTLSMPAQSISITFNREYDATAGSLVTISGTINKKDAKGYTLFNPVPLMAFGGAPMTSTKSSDTLTIVSNTEISFNGVTVNNFIYVPVMYILAYTTGKSVTMMSFGTNGLSGNTCIVTVDGAMSVVSAHP